MFLSAKQSPLCQNSAVFGALSNVFTSGFIYTLFIDGTLHSPKVDLNTNLKNGASVSKRRGEKEKRKNVD